MSSRNRRMVVAVALVLTPVLFAGTAIGQTPTNTWIATASGNWSGANWDANGVPVSGAATVVQFNGGSGVSYTATQDIAAGFQLNGIIGNNSGSGATVTANTGDSFTFVANGGVGPFIDQNSSGTLTLGAAITSPTATFNASLTLGGGSFAITALTNPVAFLGSALNVNGYNTTANAGGASLPSSVFTVNGNGIGNINFSGILTGTPTSFTINTGANNFGSGAVTLGAANTFTASGGVILQSGNLAITNATGLGAATNVLTIDGGSLRVSVTVPNPIVMNNTDLLYVGANNGVLTGPITVTGTAGLQIPGTGALTLDNTAGFNGPTIVGVPGISNGGTLTIGSTATTTGSLLNTPSITINAASNSTSGSVIITNATADATRLSSSTSITLNSGRFSYVSSATLSNTVSLGAVTVNGFGGIGATTGAADTSATALTFTSLALPNNATIGIRGEFGSGPTVTFTNGVVVGPSFTALAPVGSTTPAILPWAVGDFTLSGSNATAFNSLVTTTAGNGVRVLNPASASDFNIIGNGGSFVAGVNNIYGSANTNNPAAIPANTTIQVNSLVLADSNSPLITGGNGSVLQVFSGAIVNTGGARVFTPSIDFGSNTGYIYNSARFFTYSSFTGSAGLVVSGYTAGLSTGVYMSAYNPFSGGLTINGGGLVQFASDAAIGAAGSPITLGGGSLEFNGNGSYTLNRPLTLTPAGGTLMPTGQNGEAVPMLLNPALVSGTGPLVINGSGTVALSGSASGSWSTVVTSGIVQFADASDFGSGPIILNGGTLQPTTSGTFARALQVNSLSGASSTIDVGSQNLTISGPISAIGYGIGAAQGTTLAKAGVGTLTLTANNPFTGIVAVNAGTLTLSGAGALSLAGTAGSAGASVAAGATFTLDNTAVNNPARFTAPLTLAGGSFNVLGNSGGTATSIGMLTSTNVGSVLSLAPASGASEQLTASSLNFTVSNATLVIRGTGLGGSGANTSKMFFNSAPTPVNGIINGVLGDNDPVNGGGSYLVTYSAANGIIPATLTPAGGSITTTANNLLASGGNNLPASAAVNSLTLAAGASVTGNGNTITLTSGMLVAQSGGASSTDMNTTIANATSSLPLIIAVAGTGNLTINGTITSTSNALVKFGAGTLTLAGSPTLTGAITVGAGTLEIPVSTTTQAGTIAGNAPATVSVDGSLSLTGTGSSTFFGTVAGAGGLIRTSAATGTQTLAGPISITGGLESDAGTLAITTNVPAAVGSIIIGGNTSTNTATLNLAPGVTVSAGIHFEPGTIRVLGDTSSSANQAPITLAGTVTLDPGVVLQVPQNNAVFTLTGQLTGSGTVQLGSGTTTGGGTLNLPNANNSFSGQVSLVGAPVTVSLNTVLGLGSSSSLGTGSLVVVGGGSSSLAGGGYLQALNPGITIANPVTVSNTGTGGAVLGLVGTNSLTLTSVDVTAQNLSIDNHSSNGSLLTITTLAGNVGAGLTNVMIGFPTNQTVNNLFPVVTPTNIVSVGTLSNGGSVTVNGGTLQITGTATAMDEGSNPTGPITVAKYGTLTGPGTINRNTEIAGTIAPGNGASGTMTLNNSMVWDAGGKYSFAYSATSGLSAGVNYNTISSTSSLDVSGVTSTNPFTINISRVGNPAAAGAVTYTLGSFSGGITGFSASDFVVTGTYSGTPTVQLDGTGDLLQLVFTSSTATAWTWTGNTSGLWSVGTNWSPTSSPASDSNTQLIFGATANASMTNDITGTLTLNSMTFNAGSPVYALYGNGLNFVTNSSGALPTLVSNSSNSVTLNVPLTLTNNLTVSGSGNMTLLGAIGGAGSLTMAGSGVLTLGNTGNAYSGGTNVLSGTLQVAADAELGTGNVTGAAAGTLAFTGSTTTARSFAMGLGTITVASGQTVTLNGSVVSGANLDGTGTFATSATNGAHFLTVTSTASVAIASNSAKDQFVHFTNSSPLTFAGGLNPTVSTAITNLNGFTNEGAGSVTIGAGSAINASNFQSYGVLTLLPNTTSAPTVFTNTGTTPLNFNGGSRTFIGTSGTADPTGQNIVDYVDLHGSNAIVSGGLFVNNGGIFDTSTAGTATIIADFGSLVKGAGFYQNTVKTQNGGKFQTGNSPGSATFGNFVFGPGGVNNYVFAIDNATGAAGPSPGPSGLVSGWGLIKAVQASIGAMTTTGNFTWTATPSNPLTVAIDTLVNPTMSGTDVAGPMADFDPSKSYSWLAAQWTGSYAGPSTSAALDAATGFETNDILNPIAGSFGWNLDSAENTLSLVYTPTGVPEPGTLALMGLAAAGLAWRRCFGRGHTAASGA